ncbi:hypothetical protein AB0K87_01615 [Streptomyces sp. NPDC053705]|uniref:hypothetical protein n=1 Tax=Streptomyces TaxID=1883 RepID=UPI0034172BA7
MDTTTRTQLEEFADFYRTITPNTEAEQNSLDLLHDDREAFIAALTEDKDVTIEVTKVAGGTITTTDMFSPAQLAAARTRRQQTTGNKTPRRVHPGPADCADRT